MGTTRMPSWLLGMLAIVASTAANLIILYFTKPLAPEFKTLSTFPVTFWSILGGIGAIVVFLLAKRYAKNPRRTFDRIAWTALILSFIPDIALLLFDVPEFTGVSTVGVLVLMIMHVVSFTIIMVMLLKLGKLERI